MDVLDLYAKISLDTGEYEKGLNDASGKTSSFADKLKNGLATAAKVGAAAIGAAATAVGALAKASLDAYANQEQLIGGVETLFGAGGKSIEEYAASVGKTVEEVKYDYAALMEGQEKVLSNAADAYKTAGLSANEYMETVTSFAAALVSSLGGQTDIAADVANTAISDMADNANKMGTSMESIQNAYQGFAKQNYTMLDNLKLGFGGTKEEMQRLLDTAGELTGREFDISNFADIVDAIHAVQEEMGITGTTAKEASQTISGSIASMKSAWKNLVAGIADENADMGQLMGNVVESVVTVGQNVLPRVQQILSGIGTAIQQIAPIISDQLPVLVETVLPSLLSAGTSLLTGIMDGILAAAPSLTNAVVEIFMLLTTYITDENNLRTIIESAVQIIVTLANGLSEALPELIPAIIDAIIFIGKTLIEHAPELLDAAWQIIKSIAQGLLNAFPELEVVWASLKQGFSNAWEAVKNVWSAVTSFFSGIWDGIKSIFSNVNNWFSEKFTAAKNGIVNVWSDIKSRFSKIWSDIKSALNFKDALNWGKDLINNFINGITEKWNALKNKVSSVAQTVKNFLGFSEPKEGPLSNFHTYAPDMMKLFAQGIEENADIVRKQFDKSLDFGTASVDYSSSGMGRMSGGIGSAVQGAVNEAGGALADIVINLTANLDGKPIYEGSYRYARNRERAYGVA